MWYHPIEGVSYMFHTRRMPFLFFLMMGFWGLTQEWFKNNICAILYICIVYYRYIMIIMIVFYFFNY